MVFILHVCKVISKLNGCCITMLGSHDMEKCCEANFVGKDLTETQIWGKTPRIANIHQYTLQGTYKSHLWKRRIIDSKVFWEGIWYSSEEGILSTIAKSCQIILHPLKTNILLMEGILHQLRLVVYPISYRVLYIPVVQDFHQQ